MDKDKMDKLEHKFDRKLTEGEAAEITHSDVIHDDDEQFYEDRDMSNDIQTNGAYNRLIP